MKTVTTPNRSAVTRTVTRSIRGQGLTEYIIIVSLIAVAAFSAASYFGDSVKASFVAMGSKLTGQADYDMTADTKTSLDKATKSVTTETGMQNYRD